MMDPTASPPDPTPLVAEVFTTPPLAAEVHPSRRLLLLKSYLHLLTNYIANESAN